ncbi:MAG: hypothetical protein LC667_21160 [Thioalkalivibrio sp.]|nr:hypothetical protein [Thioalkalivibrio sp.]
MPRTLSKLLALLVVAVLAATSFAQTVTFAETEEPDTLDPHKTSTALAGRILRYAGDTLLTKDLSGTYADGLAATWSASDDGLTWTFTLKAGSAWLHRQRRRGRDRRG